MASALRALQSWVARDAVPSESVAQPRRGAASQPTPDARRSRASHRSRNRLARPQLRRLPAGAVVGFAVDDHARVTCLGGELWVTGPGTDDQILGVGQGVSVEGKGRVVVEALREARFVVAR